MPDSKGPGGLTFFGLLLLAGSIGATYWWLSRPAPDLPPPPVEGDVFCSGRVDAAGPMVALEPAVPGRVAEVMVSEGATVTKGQDILHLDDSTARARLAQADAAVEGAAVEVAAAEQEAARLPLQIAAREKLVDAVGSQVAAAEASLRQRKEQAKLTKASLGTDEEAAYVAQIQGLKNQEAGERKAIDILRKSDPKLAIRAANARLKAFEADRAVALRAVDECRLRAPANGTVLRLSVAPGAVLAPGSPYPPLVFAPAGPLVVLGEVDQEFLGRLAVGQAAECQDENRPDAPLVKGTVADVAGWVAPKRALLLEPGEATDVRTIEVRITLDLPAGGPKLWIGQRMRVRLVRPAGPSAATPATANR